MYSLRKRFRHEITPDDLIPLAHRCHSDDTHFTSLPIEIYYLIFDKLDLKSLLTLRLVNAFFKHLIDTARHVWTKIKLRAELTSSFNMDQFWEFFNSSKPNLNHIVLNCEKVVKKFKKYKVPTPASKKLNITVDRINIQSLFVLNIFASYCHSLNVTSFLNSSGPVKSESELENFRLELNEFPELISASVKFILYDKIAQKSYIWNDIYLNSFLEVQFHSVFKNVKNLSLHSYHGSSRTFLKTLKNLKNLERLEVDSCLPVDDINLNDYSNLKNPEDSPFTNRKSLLPLLKVLRVNQATPAVTLSMIARLVDPEKLEELIFNLEVKSAISNEAKDWLKLLLKYLKCLKNLTNVQTNLFYCISLRQFKNFRRR